jgi:hypothetical protein
VEQRRLMQTEFHRYFAGADAVLLPSSPITAKPIDGAHDADAPFGLFARLVNLMDLASLSIPMGDAEGLPTAVQIVVRRYADPLALRIGRALEVQRGGLFVPPPGYERLDRATAKTPDEDLACPLKSYLIALIKPIDEGLLTRRGHGSLRVPKYERSRKFLSQLLR